MTAVESRDSRLWSALNEVEDPELPLGIVDLGLVVDAHVRHHRASVQITFTSMGCPAMDMIEDDIRARLLREPGIEGVDVEIVWEPIWTKDRLTEDGKMALREWGISL